MRAASKAAWILGGVATCLPLAAGAAFTINPKPENFEEIQTKLGEIPEYLDNGEYCGGWNLQEGVGDQVGAGKIAKVEGLPGRSGQPLGAVFTGMAKRDENLQFPESAVGLSTACDMEQGGLITKSVWSDAANGKVERQFHHPDFDDPPCLRRSENPSNQPVDWPPGTYDEPPPHTEGRCQEFCEWVNKFHYQDCKILERQLDDDCNPMTGGNGQPVKKCVRWEDRYTCTDAWVNGGNVQETVEACTPPEEEASRVGAAAVALSSIPPPAFGGHAPGHVDTAPNCTVCAGGDCRCEAPPGMQCTLRATAAGGNNAEYKSFFRKYAQASYNRAAVPDVQQDRNSNQAKVACYGFYDEFDPKKRQTIADDRRCMIDIDVSDYDETQKGKGTIQVTGVVDPDPSRPEQQRGTGAYNDQTDLWHLKLGRAFSFLNEKVFKEKYKSDLTSVYLDADALDTGDLAATWQFSQQKPMAASAYVRAFDDTGENRAIVRWWQKQQTEAASLFHRPVIRMLLPSSWSYGIDMNDPLFRGSAALPELKPSEARSRSIEIQIQADEDMLGAVLGYLERSMVLKVREEPVPLVVPLGSPTQFRAAAEEWCSWWIRKSSETNCDNAPGEVQALMSRLEEYADRIEEVRTLRAGLATYAGAILSLQHDITKPLSDWIAQNVETYRKIIDEQKEIANDLLPQWNEIQEAYVKFGRETNMPWCMEQRFTIPVYSLLDEWMPSRAAEGRLYAAGSPDPSHQLPDLAGLELRPQDLVLDLSSIAFMTGSVVIPTLKPIQVRLDLPKPPGLNGEHGLTGDELPEFPDMTLILGAIFMSMQQLPRVDVVNSPSPVEPPQPLGEEKMEKLRTTIASIKETIGKMDKTYGDFWGSLTAFEDPESAPTCEGGEELHPLECCSWDAFPCVHVEMDLMERMTRIGSRPLVQLTDDYRSVGEPKLEGSVCLPQDHACDILNPEREEPGVRWEVLGDVSGDDSTEKLRIELRKLTLPRDVGEAAPEDLPPYDIEPPSLLPPFDVPSKIDLSVPTP